jgi:hypothetical protein
MSKSKATTTVHAVLAACFAYGEGIDTLRATFKGKSPDAVRAALLPDVASFPKYAVPLVAGAGKAEGKLVLDSEHKNYEACRKALGRLVKDIVGGGSAKTEELEVPPEVAAAAAKLAKLCAQYEQSRKLASTAIAQAFAA